MEPSSSVEAIRNPKEEDKEKQFLYSVLYRGYGPEFAQRMTTVVGSFVPAEQLIRDDDAGTFRISTLNKKTYFKVLSIGAEIIGGVTESSWKELGGRY